MVEGILKNKIKWSVMFRAVGLMCLSWAALPIIYYLLLKNEKKKGMGEENGS